MTGIERLVDIVNDGPYSGGMIHISVHKLREICDQIEAEAGVETVKSEAMEALAFVEEKGGLDELKKQFEASDRSYDRKTFYDRLALGWIEENGGFDGVKERLMPEDMEWPKYTDGSLVEIGDEVVGSYYGEHIRVDEITFHANGFTLREKTGLDHWYESDDRFERPAVLAADGEPLEVGQSVWSANGDELIVGAIEDGGHTVACRYVDVGDGIPVHGMWSPSDLTHQRPVLDADGVPINEGDTVWHKGTGKKYRVFRFSDEEDRVWGESDLGSFFLSCSMLTHTKPEPPDSAERIAEDIRRMAEEWCSYPTLWEASEKAASSVGEATMGLALRNLSKRCRALAERERGE